MNTNLANLESLLRSRKLDGSLVSTHPPHVERLVTTGVHELDAQLGGGLVRGQLYEIVGPCSSGRTSVMVAMLAAATGRGEVVALIDTFDSFDPPSGHAAGIDLSRLLWIRGWHNVRMTAQCIERAIKAAGLVFQAGRFGTVVIDFVDAPVAAIRRLPFTTWRRLARAIEASETVGVVIGSTGIGRSIRSAGGRSIVLGSPQRSIRWSGHSRSRVLQGINIDAHVESTRYPSRPFRIRVTDRWSRSRDDLRPPTHDPRLAF